MPPPGAHLVRFFGVLAPNARLRPLVVPRPPAPAEPPPATARNLDHLHLPSRPLPLARAQDPPQFHLYA